MSIVELAMAFKTALILGLAISTTGFPKYVAKVPNGDKVAGVEALGHVNPAGGGARNAFGAAFKLAGATLSMQASSIDAAEARGKHVCALVADQQHREIDREKRIHQTHNSTYMDAVASVAIERYEAADQLMRILDVQFFFSVYHARVFME
ncbi:hypothetical protein DYB28_007381 [Aphanomyces astaci]|uniref:Temptin Cys/Cys disulfide domain-containing protein n=1 Tax=Aphanomyces astaci TaxID=112090 RepID=A0A397AP70_APHAT|nr:hypothetical protein DYB36_002748 [Aphanomyces astaci]RHY67495.1 hypothetical protein DYB38_007120 [Aphanomyces astaci]RHY82879.1 hypothetical protein DYB31_004040 [Aphanomyces astaci]RHZ38485.1 hypothetical protein DYB26_013261 [Aphanomyces astaci]RLO13545.1 hypothetical protein DYB28_007381 [Aphanomyces astaci]